MAEEIDFGYLTREEALAALGIADADDPKLAGIAALSWGGNALKVLQVNATENGWAFVAVPALGAANTWTAAQSFTNSIAVTTAGASVKFALSAAGAIASLSGVKNDNSGYAQLQFNALTDINFSVATAGFGAASIMRLAADRADFLQDIRRNGTRVVSTRGAAVADAVPAAGAPTQAEFNALVTVVNTLLARLRAATGHGLIA